jgi:hypothetical protein
MDSLREPHNPGACLMFAWKSYMTLSRPEYTKNTTTNSWMLLLFYCKMAQPNIEKNQGHVGSVARQREQGDRARGTGDKPK